MKVFQLSEFEWIAANSLSEAISFYKKETGEDADEDYTKELTPEEMNKFTIRDEDEPEEKRKTFQQSLEELLADPKQKLPCIFATTEF